MKCSLFRKHFKTSLYLICAAAFVSCNTLRSQNADDGTMLFSDGTPIITAENEFNGRDTILLTFEGDLMAHRPNWTNKDFVTPLKSLNRLASEADFAFINVETPVAGSKEWSTYPYFNVHGSYAEAAVETGFNVFSLSNNHTNDQGLDGIKETKKFFDSLREKTSDSQRPVYSSGLKDSPKDEMSYEILEKNGWKILYLAVTELLNQNIHTGYINFVKPDKTNREEFYKKIKKLKEESGCDFFILSLHSCDEEYVLTTPESQKQHYQKILENGADILLSNHPHVSKEWYLYVNENGTAKKMLFMSQGNTLSAQRNEPDFKKPSNIRDYTGDGFVTQVRLEKTEDGISIVKINPVLITLYITKQRRYVVKILNDEFIDELKKEGRKDWSAYLLERKKLMEKIKGKIIWQ